MPYLLHNIESSYTCSVLLALLERDKCSRDLETELEVPFTTVKTATTILLGAECIEKWYESVKPFRIFFNLTDKGRMVAEHLSDIEKGLGQYYKC